MKTDLLSEVEQVRDRYNRRVITRLDASGDDDGHWVTTKEGNHMFINGEGEPTKGNPYVISAAKGETNSTSSAKNSPSSVNDNNRKNSTPDPPKASENKSKKNATKKEGSFAIRMLEKEIPKETLKEVTDTFENEGYDSTFSVAADAISEHPDSYEDFVMLFHELGHGKDFEFDFSPSNNPEFTNDINIDRQSKIDEFRKTLPAPKKNQSSVVTYGDKKIRLTNQISYPYGYGEQKAKRFFSYQIYDNNGERIYDQQATDYNSAMNDIQSRVGIKSPIKFKGWEWSKKKGWERTW